MKGCKKCPAFDKCTVTHRGSACAALRRSYGIDTDPEIITNADQIRAMNDLELADQLVVQIDGLETCRMYLSAPVGKLWISRIAAREVNLKWLQQPADKTAL